MERALLVFGVIAEKQKLSTMADVPTAVKPLYELLRNTARLRADLRAGQDAPPEAMLNAAQALIATAEARLASESAQGTFAKHVRDASAAAAAPGRSMDGSTPTRVCACTQSSAAGRSLCVDGAGSVHGTPPSIPRGICVSQSPGGTRLMIFRARQRVHVLHAVLRGGAIPMRGRRRLGSWDAA